MSTTFIDPDEEWNNFVAGHRQQLEDALLPTLAEAQGAGIIADPFKQLVAQHDEMRRQAAIRGITVSYPDGEPAPGTPMKVAKMASPIDGGEVEVPLPADIPAKGMRITINGIDAILFPDPEPEATATVFDQDEVDEAVAQALDVHAKAVGRSTTGGGTVMGLLVGDELRDELVEAWDHYADHGCGPAAAMLDRIIEQVIEELRRSR